MPRIGRIIASPDVPNPSRPTLLRSAEVTSPFDSAEKTFELVGKHTAAIQASLDKSEEKRLGIERDNKVIELSSSAKLRGADLETSLKENPNPDQHYDRLWRGMQAITQQHLDAIGNDPEARRDFLKSWAPHMDRALATGMYDQFKLRVGRSKGDLRESLDAGIKLGVDLPIDQLDAHITGTKDKPGSGLEGQIEASRKLFEDQEDVSKWKLEYRKKAYQEHAAHAMRTDPGGFLDMYLGGAVPYKGRVDQSALDKLAEQAQSRMTHAATELDRKRKQVEKETEVKEKKAVGVLVRAGLDGKLTMTQVDTELRVNDYLAANPDAIKDLHAAATRPAREGGVTNWTLFGSLYDSAQSGKLDSKDVLANRDQLAHPQREKLLSMIDNTVLFKDEYYQRGMGTLRSHLQPAANILDEGRQKRFAAAADEYDDRAAKLFKTGKREELPVLARDIVDRFLKQYSDITAIPPAFVPRYPTREETYSAFERGEMDRREYDRQSWLHDQLKTLWEYQKPKPAPAGAPAPGNKPNTPKTPGVGDKLRQNLPSPFDSTPGG